MRAVVLIDDKIGSSKQAISLANILELNFITYKVKDSFILKLPNIIRFLDYLFVSRELLYKILSLEPKVIICAGRRLSRIAKLLKSLKSDLKIIQILKPEINIKYFDAIILPKHDNYYINPYHKHKVVKVTGGIVNNKSEVVEKALKWVKPLSQLASPRIALLIGNGWTKKHALSLVQQVLDMVKQLNGSLMVTSSRRTKSKLKDLIFSRIKQERISHYIYDAHSNEDNPYHAFLAWADYIVVTGDSISMCTESLQMNKPVIVYAPIEVLSSKHWRFIENLVKDGHINLLKNFNPDVYVLPKEKHEELKEKVFSLIQSK